MKTKIDFLLKIFSGFLIFYLFFSYILGLPFFSKLADFCFVYLGQIIFGLNKLVVISFPLFFLTAIVLTAYSLASLLKVKINLERRKVRDARVEKLSEIYKLKGRVIIVKEKKPFAKVLGFFSPKIYLSSGLIKVMSFSELKAVLIHEKSHLESKDNLLRIILFFVSYSTPFYLIFSWLFEKFIEFQEVKADRLVVKALGKRPLLLAMRKLLDDPFGDKISSGYANYLERRLKAITKAKVNTRSFLPPLFIVVLFIFLLPLVAKGGKKTSACFKGTSCWKSCVGNSSFY